MQAHPLNVPISNIITYRFGFMQRNTTGKIVSHILIYPEIITNKNNYSPKFTYTIFVKNSNILLQHLSSKKHNLNSKPNLISPAKSGREVLGAPAKKFSSRRNCNHGQKWINGFVHQWIIGALPPFNMSWGALLLIIKTCRHLQIAHTVAFRFNLNPRR